MRVLCDVCVRLVTDGLHHSIPRPGEKHDDFWGVLTVIARKKEDEFQLLRGLVRK